MEDRVAAMDEQLENESKERQNAVRASRRLDKRVKEVMLQVGLNESLFLEPSIRAFSDICHIGHAPCFFSISYSCHR